MRPWLTLLGVPIISLSLLVMGGTLLWVAHHPRPVLTPAAQQPPHPSAQPSENPPHANGTPHPEKKPKAKSPTASPAAPNQTANNGTGDQQNQQNTQSGHGNQQTNFQQQCAAGSACAQGAGSSATTNNYGDPPPNVTFSEDASQVGTDGTYTRKVRIKIDRQLVGPVFGVILSGPAKVLDSPVIDKAGLFSVPHGGPLKIKATGAAIENSWNFTANAVPAFTPDMELIVTFASTSEIHVLGVGILPMDSEGKRQ